jgi:monoamine oxidase
MARTRLFGILKKEARCFSSVKAAKSAVSNGTNLSRRTFLRYAALTSLAGCSATKFEVLKRKGVRSQVAIIGGGLAGLACAYSLQRGGIQSDIYEASDRVGGRQYTGRGLFAANQFVEFGGEFIDSNHEAIRLLALSLGLELEDFGPQEVVAQEAFLIDGKIVSYKQVAENFVPFAERLSEELRQANKNPEYLKKLDRTTISDWLNLQTNLDYQFKEVVRVAYLGEFGLECDQQSFCNLLWLFETDATSSFRLFGDSDQRYRIKGGNDKLATTLYSYLSQNVELSSSLEAIKIDAGNFFRLTIRNADDLLEVRYPVVVLALPFTMLRRVEIGMTLPGQRLEMIHKLGYGTNSKLFLGFNERSWLIKHQSAGALYSNGTIQNCWDTSRLQPGKSGIITVFKGGNGGVALATAQVAPEAQKAVNEMSLVWPHVKTSFNEGSEQKFAWPSHKHTLGSYACPMPGQALWGESLGESIGNLFFCGEHCSIDFQGYMEGAVETGLTVSASILQRVGRIETVLL